MRKLIQVIGIAVIAAVAATALAWSNIERKAATGSASAPLSPHDMMLRRGDGPSLGSWRAY
jgi:hypothetical protein